MDNHHSFKMANCHAFMLSLNHLSLYNVRLDHGAEGNTTGSQPRSVSHNWITAINISVTTEFQFINTSTLFKSAIYLHRVGLVVAVFTSWRHSNVISGWVLTCDSAHLWQGYNGCPTGWPGNQHHDLIFHLVTLSWHWANQSVSQVPGFKVTSINF